MDMRETKKDIIESLYLIQKGILANNKEFKNERTDEIEYVFDCPEYKELREKYNLVKIAGTGDSFERAKRLLMHFSPRMVHDPYYTNHIEQNALALLQFCYERPENGINCLNKAKILAECCLALGIYARRVIIMPYSPFDRDNHVVTEVYDETRNKWIMMDPSTNGLFVNEKGIPLSVIEIREAFSANEFVTYIPADTKNIDYESIAEKHIDDTRYICKNSFYYQIEKYQMFGNCKDNYSMYFIPKHFSVYNNTMDRLNYALQTYCKEDPEIEKRVLRYMERVKEEGEIEGTSIEVMQKPIG